MELSLAHLLEMIDSLPKKVEYDYVKPGKYKVSLESVDFTSQTVSAVKVSKNNITKSANITAANLIAFVNKVRENELLHIESVWNGSGSARSAWEALFALTPEFYVLNLDGKKNLMWCPSRPHEKGEITKMTNAEYEDLINKSSMDINSFNTKLRELRSYGSSFTESMGKGTSSLDQAFVKIFKRDLPSHLYKFFPATKYLVEGSLGTGRVSKCPWIALIDKEETTSVTQGVYLAFLFSQNLHKVYLTIIQGVTKSDHDSLIKNRDAIRHKIVLPNEFIMQCKNMDIAEEKYKESAIYAIEWPINDNDLCFQLLKKAKGAYDDYMNSKILNYESDLHNSKKPVANESSRSSVQFSINTIISLIRSTGLLYDSTLVKRFAFSLMAKRFLILSGLAGSGKTQLALVFARALVQNPEQQMCVVSVGADWTNREPLLGFPNALKEDSYVKPESGVLDLLIEANREENKNKPFFLILDEMNMSYVERYFADFLSAMESKEPIALWKRPETLVEEVENDVPSKIGLPDNLFIIGTINVDETTYMFSPKVLDRANVLEFKISSDEMSDFLDELKDVNPKSVLGKASNMSESFVELAKSEDLDRDKDVIASLKEFFDQLKSVNAEFGYRSATEIFRFVAQAKKNDDTDEAMGIEDIIDAAIVQKLLPKLHGSRKKLEPVLRKLWNLCFAATSDSEVVIGAEQLDNAVYKESADKILRMYNAANQNGFTSFAEA